MKSKEIYYRRSFEKYMLSRVRHFLYGKTIVEAIEQGVAKKIASCLVMTRCGEDGLLQKYYKAYQNVIKEPIVVEFKVWLDEAELYRYREVIPVYIEGTFYMILELTASSTFDGKSLCSCKAIRMPHLE